MKLRWNCGGRKTESDHLLVVLPLVQAKCATQLKTAAPPGIKISSKSDRWKVWVNFVHVCHHGMSN